ncbi:MAG: 4-hydroxy-3-methylbut-2-enyl diphosphate reductase [Lachnospiraceae bacterium]|nr:4-hydroxy-3-methylbut-2-enyl diphosphate reductase [Lachnospiraceae bacterium]
MKTVKIAKSAGFCFGVKRAVDMVYHQIGKKDLPIYTYGPIIHNEEVVKDLQEKGVRVIDSLDQLRDLPKGIVVIRSHGVDRKTNQTLEQEGFQVVDATCPFVLKIHRYVEEYCRKGYQIIIVGNPNHPEVEGIRGWGNPEQITVISTSQEAEKINFSKDQKVCIVSQTTFNYKKFQDLVEILEEKGYDIIVLNTICNATEERQTQSRALAKEVDAMIVIGGSNSSNTQKLFEICKEECENTYYIQTIADLDLQKLESIDNVGITAGASTPNNIIEEVQTNVRKQF